MNIDQILTARRSIRTFTEECPPVEMIRDILRAGLLAPYVSGPGRNGDDFRRFVVIGRDHPQMALAAALMRKQVHQAAAKLRADMEADPRLAEMAEAHAGRLERIVEQGVMGVGTAPYFIVVAERKSFPAVEQQSLAHCLQNMWLKAVSLGLGFHLVSATAPMAGDRDFCERLGIPFGEFELNGCAVGYPAKYVAPATRPDVEDVTTWWL
jgi:nitroreductase